MATLLEDYLREDPIANAYRSCAPPAPPLLPLNSKQGVQPLTRSLSEVMTRHLIAPFTTATTSAARRDKRSSFHEDDWIAQSEASQFDHTAHLGLHDDARRRMRPGHSRGVVSPHHQRASSDSSIRKRQIAASKPLFWDDEYQMQSGSSQHSSLSFSSTSSAMTTPNMGARTPSSHSLGLVEPLDTDGGQDLQLVTSDGDHFPADFRAQPNKNRSPPQALRSLPDLHAKTDSSAWDGPAAPHSATMFTFGLASRLMKLVETVKDNVVILAPSDIDLEEGFTLRSGR